jgi:zinc transport system substrate-binding protein
VTLNTAKALSPRPARGPTTQCGRRRLGQAGLPALVLLALVALLVGCGSGSSTGPAATADKRPLVVTTNPLIYSLTANVAGNDIRLENLLRPGASPHQTTFTPEQAKKVAEADMIVMNGAGLELWAGGLIKSAGSPGLKTVVATQGVPFLAANKPVPLPGGGSNQAEATNVDPHVWLDPKNAIIMVDNIRDGLKALDPAHAAAYNQRASAYAARLQQLDKEIKAQTSSFARKDFISFHSAWQYYARAYGLDQVAVLEEFPGKEPSAQYLAGLVDLVKRLNVRAVIAEPQFSSRPADALARETGARVYTADPEGSTLGASMYEDLLRKDTQIFTQALGGTQ